MNALHSANSQRGVGLVEVLVALLLLGIAVIGFAALQVRAVSSTHDALYRTQGMAIAQEMVERIRANPRQLATYRLGTSGSTTPTSCITATCNATTMAQFDIAAVRQLAATSLPNGQLGLVTCPGASNLCVLVSWNATTPTVGTAAPSCLSTTGSYITNAECMMMESY